MFKVIQNIPFSHYQRFVYSEKFKTLYEDLNLNSNTKYYYWLVTLRGILLSYLCVFFDISPRSQIFVLTLYQSFILGLFFKRFELHKVFQDISLNFITMCNELLLLIMKIMILGFLSINPHLESDLSIVVFSWLMVTPAVINQIIQSAIQSAVK